MARHQLILDRYRVIDQAGAGGYGTVQHAYDTRLKRDVAIKCIELSEADVARARLLAMEERMRGEGALPEGAASPLQHEGPALPAPVAGFDASDDADGFLDDVRSERDLGAVSASRVVDIVRTEALPWEDEVVYPEDPAFLDAREGSRELAGAREDFQAQGQDAEEDALLASEGRVSPSLRESGAREGAFRPLSPLGSAKTPARHARGRADAGRAPAPAAAAAVPAGDDAHDADDDALFDHVPGLEEARTAAHLNDANIVTVYDCEVHGDTAYVIMEYVEGKTLSCVLRELGDDISLDVIAAVFTSVAHALEVAHDNDVLHLDIKPENVIVNKKGVVKVTDFGLATLMDASGHATTGGGTIGYMPPEQMRQEKLDVRTDEWALASLTYEMLSGSNPFLAEDIEEAESLIEEAELVLPSLCWDSLGADADDIVFEALDPDPDERFETVAAFAEELTPLLGSARAGKKALAALVSEEEEEPQPEEPSEPRPPLIDRIGPRGAAAFGRVAAVAASAMVGAVSLVNMRFASTSALGLATDNPAVFWALLAALAALAAFRPAFGVAAAYAMFAVMLAANQAYVPAVILLLAAGAWWWLVGRRSDGAASAALMQPLLGSVGLAPVAPIAAGVVLDVREAAATGAFAAVSAFAFASLGSDSLVSWDVVANAVTAANPQIGGAYMTNSFMAAVTSPGAWIVALSWPAAAALYSAFCLKGTRAFDIAGSVVSALTLLAGLLLACAAQSMWDAGTFDVAALGGLAWAPDPLSLVGVLASGAIGVALAVLSVPDRVRLAEGEW